MTIDTLKQAAQALAFEAGKRRERGDLWLADNYDRIAAEIEDIAAPIATPEHDAQVRDAVLEEAAFLCDGIGYALDGGDQRYERYPEVIRAAYRIRARKTTGDNHAA